MKRKYIVLTVIFLLFVNPFSFTFAKEKLIYKKVEKLANQYIKNSLEDENWKDKNPYINWLWKYFYTDDDNKSSYIEFKVSCDEEINCGFILVNSDWNDVSVPMASTSWIWPWEYLSIWEVENKLYYFSPFEQYSLNTKNNKIKSISINDNIEKSIKNDSKLTEPEKEQKIKEKDKELKERLKDLKQEAKKYKESEEFKKKKKEIKNQILSVPKEEFVMNSLNMANASNLKWNWGTAYEPTTYSSNILIPWYTYSSCSWKIPCYEQFETNYNWQYCLVWCVPLAYSMIYGYYDRRWQFSNLVPWIASTLNSSEIENMTQELGAYLWTYCTWTRWDTNAWDMDLGITYAVNKWYTNSTSTYYHSNNKSYLFNLIKYEINNERPLIWWTGDHAFVIFWYYNTSNSDIKIVRVNIWWWNLYNVTDENWNIYLLSNVDYNIDSIYYWWNDHEWIKHLVKVIVSN